MSDATFRVVMRLLRVQSLLAERFSGELGAVHGLSLNEALLLLHIENAPVHRLSRIDLAKRLHVSASTITRMAAPLEKSGVLGRQPDPRDSRLAYVILTPAGAQLAAEARATLERRSAELFRENWSEHEVSSLSAALGRLVAGQPGGLG